MEMTHEERAAAVVRGWMEIEKPGEMLAFPELVSRIATGMAEASNASEDAKLLTFLIQQSNFGDDWLSERAWDECYDAAADESDDHDPEDYQYWMRKAIKEAIKEAMEEKSR